MNSGSRNEMVFIDGFNLENVTDSAFPQSMNSVESDSAQKSRSSSSFLNLGIF